MEVEKWLNKEVKIVLNNNTYYKGTVVECGESHIRILDINNNDVEISTSFIAVIQEWGKK